MMGPERRDRRVAAAKAITEQWKDQRFTSREFHRWRMAHPSGDIWNLFKAFESLKRRRVIVKESGSTHCQYAWYTVVRRGWGFAGGSG